jgi:putative nucleotidyltransferase with HDIG domain
VVYVDNRARAGIFQEADLTLISAFADQAAVAIDSARLFEELQQSHRELERAYEATLEGWAKALELRDEGTEGHTQRVAVLTERLARSMGIGEEMLVHIKRGALLHDIGKMGIPDNILRKNGPLTDEERLIMEKHPRYAYEMLSSIEFLLPALDIPYCHHERWDGTGYPRGLQGEQIPFAARIFPVTDVWDALTSDRPYRKALPCEEVRQQIQDASGTHFDPDVVEAFMELKDLSTGAG